MALRLLIVDDSAAMRAVIQRTVEVSDMDVQCVTAEHGNAALSVLHQQDIDLLLIDVNMPGMKGDELVQRLAEDPELASIPFLAMSSDTTVPRVQQMLELGALAYISKPFAPATLRAQMSKALEQMLAAN
jgi:two-component system chemotaxis response regulator CheY